MEPGALTATQLKVEPEVVQRSGEQCSNIAPEIDTQVHRRLQVAGESVTPAEWTGVAREPFDTLHARLTQQSGALAEKVAALGLTLTQSAMGYLKADDLGVRLMSGQPTPGGDWTLLDGNLVTGREPLPRSEMRGRLQALEQQGRVTSRALSSDELEAATQAEKYQAASEQAPNTVRNMRLKRMCWAVDESGGKALVEEYGGDYGSIANEVGAIDDQGPLPAGFSGRLPRTDYEQYSWGVKDYADGSLHEFQYELPENALKDNVTRGGEPGLAAASHAEKQASMRGAASKRIGVNIVQCQDCKAYFQAVAQQRQVYQVVADPEVTRIFYPNGEVGLVTEQDGQRLVYIFSREDAFNAFHGQGAPIP